MKDRILQLAINGLKPTEIVDIVGCSPSYISQLFKDPAFKEKYESGLMEAQATRTEEDHLDVKYQGLEHDLIKAAKAALPEASLGEISRAMEVLQKREQAKFARKHPAPTNPGTSINIISLALPSHALQQHVPAVQMNDNKEILAIDGRILAPMSADGVKNIFAQRQNLLKDDSRVVAEI